MHQFSFNIYYSTIMMVLHISTRLKCCKTFQSLFQPLFHNQTNAIDCTLLFEPRERKMGDFV